MKNKHIVLPAIVFALIALMSCQTRTRTTSRLAGVWSSDPERLTIGDSVGVGMINVYEFIRLTDTGGYVTISSMVSIEESVVESDSNACVCDVRASAIASVTGKFEAVSYDKVDIDLDPGSFRFKIDPASIRCRYDDIDQSQLRDIVPLQLTSAEKYRDKVAPAIRSRLMAGKEISDIKFVKSMVSCLIDGKEVVLRYQSSE